jgi:hypothetical protein
MESYHLPKSEIFVTSDLDAWGTGKLTSFFSKEQTDLAHDNRQEPELQT